VLDGVQIPHRNGQFSGSGRACSRQHSGVSCAKTAEATEMPFGLWTLVDPKKHLLDGVQIARAPYQGAIIREKDMPGQVQDNLP